MFHTFINITIQMYSVICILKIFENVIFKTLIWPYIMSIGFNLNMKPLPLLSWGQTCLYLMTVLIIH